MQTVITDLKSKPCWDKVLFNKSKQTCRRENKNFQRRRAPFDARMQIENDQVQFVWLWGKQLYNLPYILSLKY